VWNRQVICANCDCWMQTGRALTLCYAHLKSACSRIIAVLAEAIHSASFSFAIVAIGHIKSATIKTKSLLIAIT